VLAFVGLVFAGSAYVPEVFEERSETGNVFGRAAQFEQSLAVFAEHPLLGVGFSNFNNVVTGESRYRASYQGVSSVDSTGLNIWYAFVIAVCYKYGLTAPESEPPAEAELAEKAFSAPQRTFSPVFFR